MNNLYLNVIAVACGGALGASVRYIINTWSQRLDLTLPLGTLVSNYLGCVLIGWCVATRFEWSPLTRVLVIPGILGGLTTMSGFAMEMVSLIDERKWAMMVKYGLLTLIGCIVMTWISWRLSTSTQG